MLMGAGRRFSKTQKIIKFDENLEVSVINNWIDTLITE
jgi:hypothetical protein